MIIKFDGEDTFMGILKDKTNLRKLVETGAVDINGESIDRDSSITWESIFSDESNEINGHGINKN